MTFCSLCTNQFLFKLRTGAFTSCFSCGVLVRWLRWYLVGSLAQSESTLVELHTIFVSNLLSFCWYQSLALITYFSLAGYFNVFVFPWSSFSFVRDILLGSSIMLMAESLRCAPFLFEANVCDYNGFQTNIVSVWCCQMTQRWPSMEHKIGLAATLCLVLGCITEFIATNVALICKAIADFMLTCLFLCTWSGMSTRRGRLSLLRIALCCQAMNCKALAYHTCHGRWLLTKYTT